ncbi:LysR family transcriptional regulator [Alcaligenes faecalis]|uniref:LysR family transcriptional regulator n=1 Tax=Alcaligenes faecalis TaxID=511 RepID=UPI0018EF18D7|nr:LysR family transcriptional regulator [Alcaligenes faecalis]
MLENVPLVPLRVFVAVGRQGNFTRAAQSLGITQSAVSRHIATLEKVSKQALFIRRGPYIELTAAGLQLYDTVKDAMATLEMAIQQITHQQDQHERLRVRTSMPSFSMTVLVPMLGQFTAQHNRQIDLITNLSPPRPNEEFDVLISRDLSLPDSESWELIREELVCVAAPALIQQHSGQAWEHWPMVTARSRPDMLGLWALNQGIEPSRLLMSATYDHLFFAIAGAIAGSGFLVVPRLLVMDHLRDGVLREVGPGQVATGATYMAYVNAQSPQQSEARQFCRWLKSSLRKRIAP